MPSTTMQGTDQIGDNLMSRTTLHRRPPLVGVAVSLAAALVTCTALPALAADTGGAAPALGAVYDAYIDVQEALAGDDLDAARAGFEGLGEAIRSIPTEPRGGPWAVWTERRASLADAAQAGSEAADIAAARAALEGASQGVIGIVEGLGQDGDEPLVHAYCPMAASGRGAAWLQRGEQLRNPYFGASMLACGEIRGRFAPSASSGHG